MTKQTPLTELEKRLDAGLNNACDRITDLERMNAELLAALEALLASGVDAAGNDYLSMTVPDTYIKRARAAIAKVKGR